MNPSQNSIKVVEKRIARFAFKLMVEKQDDVCKTWVDQRRSVAFVMVKASQNIALLLSLFRDDAGFYSDFKDLYDYGLVKRDKVTRRLIPCSQVACKALSYVFARLRVDDDNVPLSEMIGMRSTFGVHVLEQRIFRAITMSCNQHRYFGVHPLRTSRARSYDWCWARRSYRRVATRTCTTLRHCLASNRYGSHRDQRLDDSKARAS